MSIIDAKENQYGSWKTTQNCQVINYMNIVGQTCHKQPNNRRHRKYYWASICDKYHSNLQNSQTKSNLLKCHHHMSNKFRHILVLI